MSKHCPECGTQFASDRKLQTYWSTYFKCAQCRTAYLQVDDVRYIYHLCTIHDRRAQRMLKEESEADLAEAFSRLRHVDCYTLATEDFENALIALWYKQKEQPKGEQGNSSH